MGYTKVPIGREVLPPDGHKYSDVSKRLSTLSGMCCAGATNMKNPPAPTDHTLINTAASLTPPKHSRRFWIKDMTGTQQNNIPAIAVVGAGTIGTLHIALISDSSMAKLACIVDPTETGERLSFDYGVSHFHDVEALLKSSIHVDAAIICTPNSMHVAIATKLAAQHIHLLVEKPLSTTIAEGNDLLRACREYGVRVMTGHHRRHPQIQAAARALKRGCVGNVIGVSGLWVSLKPDSYFEGPGLWHTKSDGDVILVNLIHEIDLLQIFVGPVTRVYAEKACSLRGYAAEEGVALTLRFANGVIGTFLALDNSPSPHNIEAGTGEQPKFPFSGQDTYRFFGTTGTYSVPDNICWTPRSLKEGRNSILEPVKAPFLAASSVYERQLHNFVEMVQGREAALCDGEAGLRAVAVCEAVRKSLEDGAPHDIRLD